jgi:hypothetical protein
MSHVFIYVLSSFIHTWEWGECVGLENIKIFYNILALHIVKIISDAWDLGEWLAGVRILKQSHFSGNQTTAACTISKHITELLWTTLQVCFHFWDIRWTAKNMKGKILCYKETIVLMPNILARKLEESSLPYCNTGARWEGFIQLVNAYSDFVKLESVSVDFPWS